jgi:8-oxo-dGTP pyrophosphatase MutT (NUDIX family)
MFSTNNTDRFLSFLNNRLAKPLPGVEAHLKMAPYRKVQWEENKINQAKKSAVLLLLTPINNNWNLIFIKRAGYNGHHSNQIAFPGGKVEPYDTSYYETALRETNEEIGVDPLKINKIGELSRVFIPVSNFIVHPYIGLINEQPSLKLDKKEVEDAFFCPLQELFQKNVKTQSKVTLSNGINMKVPAFKINNHIVWGATSLMLQEFYEIIEPYAYDLNF